MKTKKLLSLILTIAMLACMLIIPANAAETEVEEHIEIIIVNQNISEKTKEKAIAFYSNGGEEQEGVATYGLTCAVLGHKIESTRVYKISHEVRATSPRCLKKSYDYNACTRCDFEESILISSIYIACC